MARAAATRRVSCAALAKYIRPHCEAVSRRSSGSAAALAAQWARPPLTVVSVRRERRLGDVGR